LLLLLLLTCDLSLSLSLSHFQAPSCNQIADNLLADTIKLFLYNNCALDEKFLRKKFSSSTTLQGWSSHTGMFVLDLEILCQMKGFFTCDW
jgi:hypothetical protein